jgi:hypothetical protein
MQTRKLERSEWKAYFDRMTRTLALTNVDIRVDGLDLGDQLQVEHVPLAGISYDPGDGAIHVDTERLHHAIPDPKAVFVQEQGPEVRCIEVIDREGHQQLIELTKALALPPS